VTSVAVVREERYSRHDNDMASSFLEGSLILQIQRVKSATMFLVVVAAEWSSLRKTWAFREFQIYQEMERATECQRSLCVVFLFSLIANLPGSPSFHLPLALYVVFILGFRQPFVISAS
jgi:hypothetical protein